MKGTMKKLLFELMKDSSRSDRKLAKVLGVSQATVSRMRNKLIKDGLIQEFAIKPDFVKLGYEIMAISVVRRKASISESTEKAMKWMKKYSNMIFAARAEGMGKNGVVITLHKNYTDYSNFLAESLTYWGDDIEDYDTILISLKGTIGKPFSLRYLAEKETSEDQL